MSSDMTSFVYIGGVKHHLSKWLVKEMKCPPAKRNYAIFIDILEKARTNYKTMLDKPGNSQQVQETILLRERLKTYNEEAGKQAQVQEVIASFCGLGN